MAQQAHRYSVLDCIFYWHRQLVELSWSQPESDQLGFKKVLDSVTSRPIDRTGHGRIYPIISGLYWISIGQ